GFTDAAFAAAREAARLAGIHAHSAWNRRYALPWMSEEPPEPFYPFAVLDAAYVLTHQALLEDPAGSLQSLFEAALTDRGYPSSIVVRPTAANSSQGTRLEAHGFETPSEEISPPE